MPTRMDNCRRTKSPIRDLWRLFGRRREPNDSVVTKTNWHSIKGIRTMGRVRVDHWAEAPGRRMVPVRVRSTRTGLDHQQSQTAQRPGREVPVVSQVLRHIYKTCCS